MSWNNRPSMVDVRIDFQPLHSVMLGRRTSSNVPAVGDYLDQLRTKKQAPRLWSIPAGAPNVSTWSSGIVFDEDIVTSPGTPTNTVDPETSLNPPPRVVSNDETDYADLQRRQSASASNPAQDRLLSERALTAERQRTEANLNQAKTTQSQTEFDKQTADQKAMEDRQLQEQLQIADSELGSTPQIQASQIANNSPGDAAADFENQQITKDLEEGVAYKQSLDGAPPGSTTSIPKELPSGGKAPGQSDSFWSGVSSKLSSAGTSIVAAGKGIATSVIDGASYKAKQVGNVLSPIGGKVKDIGKAITTTTTKPTTPEEARKADTFPTTTEETIKAQTEPLVATSQENIQAMKSEIASENQSYTTQRQVLSGALQRTTDPTTITRLNQLTSNLEATHESNLLVIENKYS